MTDDVFYGDVMVDIETTGTRPDRAAIIQIAGVKFDYDSGQVSHDFFDRCLYPMPHRGWDESTRTWWGRNREILRGIEQRAENPYNVLQAFADWAGYSHPRPLRLWAKPSHFEFPFLESHFHDANIRSPFHYRYVVDLNSWSRGKQGDLEGILPNIPMEGPAHNALNDTLHQLRCVLALRNA